MKKPFILYYLYMFKKTFAVITALLVVATTLPAGAMGSSSYSAELEGAYDYAYDQEITTMDSIDSANMYGQLIRAHLAKMMSEYAQDVVGLTADTSADCDFIDMGWQLQEMKDYAELACQLGLMGVGTAGYFNPNGLVDRATFGTVLSRATWGDANNNGTGTRYNAHLEALQTANIMTNIDNPMTPEIRGYVMLMMQRADENNDSCIIIWGIWPNWSINPSDDPNSNKVCCASLSLVNPINAYNEAWEMGEGYGTICAKIEDNYCDTRYENEWNSEDCRDTEFNIKNLFLEKWEINLNNNNTYTASIKIQNNDVDLPINWTVIQWEYKTFYMNNSIDIECKWQDLKLIKFSVYPLDHIEAGTSLYAEWYINDNEAIETINNWNSTETMCHIDWSSWWNLVNIN